ncbi:MAG: diphosphate--fructose-6-phosphate 1-phosphotransferase [Chloroflexia bacterium]
MAPSSEGAPSTLIVGQSGGPTAVINSSLVGVLREARAQGIKRVYGMRYGIRGLLLGDLVDLSSLPVEVLPALQQTPAAGLGACRYHLTDADVPNALSLLQEHGVHYMVYIGGNDSADTSHRLALAAQEGGMDLRVIAVPKTIDNDLPVTDHCPGYGSIARYMAISTLETTLDTKSMPDIYPVKILETMGRNAGWLPASAALARSTGWDTPHLIYIPERPVDIDEILSDVQRTYREKGHVVIVLSENVKCRDGRLLSVAGMEELSGAGAAPENPSPDEPPNEASAAATNVAPNFVDAFGHSYYRQVSTGFVLSELITRRLDMRARVDLPGTLQRSSQAHQSEVDLVEAEECGRAAVRAALAGTSDQMVILERAEGPLYRATIGMSELQRIANVEKHMPADFITPDGNFVTQAFIDYALPLIGGPLPQYVELQT